MALHVSRGVVRVRKCADVRMVHRRSRPRWLARTGGLDAPVRQIRRLLLGDDLYRFPGRRANLQDSKQEALLPAVPSASGATP